VQARGRGPTYKEWNLEPSALHLGGVGHHLVERRGDEAGHADHVRPFPLRDFEYLFHRYHDSEVDHLVIIARKNYTNDILANVVNIALYGRNYKLASAFS